MCSEELYTSIISRTWTDTMFWEFRLLLSVTRFPAATIIVIAAFSIRKCNPQLCGRNEEVNYIITYKCYRGWIIPALCSSVYSCQILSVVHQCLSASCVFEEMMWICLAGIYPTTGWWRSLPISSSYWGICSNCEFRLHTHNRIYKAVCKLITSINI